MNQNLKFCFKGSRNYVHGTDIVSKLLAQKSSKSLTRIDLRFNGIATTGLMLVEEHSNPDAKVNVRWMENGELRTYQLIANGEEIDCRYEYEEDSILEKTTLDLDSQSVHLNEISGYSLCENFVALNKYLLNRLYPEEKGKWYFTRLELSEIYPEESLITVKFIKNFNFRLVKSEVLVNGNAIGSVYFTMVREKS